MEAILATVIVIGLIVLGFAALARTWPRTSRLGGYRARTGDRGADHTALDEEQGQAGREDDDARWHWEKPGGQGRG